MEISRKLSYCIFVLGLVSAFVTAENEKPLSGKKAAILIADDFNGVEDFYPYLKLWEEGAEVTLIGEKANTSYSGGGKYQLVSDLSIEDADPQAYDILVIPGGGAPEIMKKNPLMVNFARSFLEDPQKWVATVCDGPQLLAATQSIEGIWLTGCPGIEREINNAKADWQKAPSSQKTSLSWIRSQR